MKNKFLALTLSLLSINCFSANDSVTTKSTATLANFCQFSSSNVSFGDYDPNSPNPLTATQNNTILCTRGTVYHFYTLSQYQGVWSYVSFRGMWTSTMKYNGNSLYFQVQMPGGQWEDDLQNGGLANSGHYVGIGTGSLQSYPRQYRILENQYVPPGNYSGYQTAYITF